MGLDSGIMFMLMLMLILSMSMIYRHFCVYLHTAIKSGMRITGYNL